MRFAKTLEIILVSIFISEIGRQFLINLLSFPFFFNWCNYSLFLGIGEFSKLERVVNSIYQMFSDQRPKGHVKFNCYM